jgi:hypothetical protein
MRKGLTKGGCRVLYNYADWPRKKKNKKLDNFILVFINFQSTTYLKQLNQPRCTLPPSHTASSITPPSLPHIFGWLLCVGSSIGGQLRPPCIVLILFFALLYLIPQMMGRHPPTRSTPAAPPIIHPIYRGHQILIGCCVLLLDSGHLRPRPQPNLYLSMGLVLAPQSMEPGTARVHRMPRACYRLIGSRGTKIWIRGKCCHGERVP